MGKAKFNLRLTKSDKAQPIYLKCQIKGKRFSYATELKVMPSKWDFEKQRVKGYGANAKLINKQLDNLQQMFDACYYDVKHSNLLLTKVNVEKCFLKKVGGYGDIMSIAAFSDYYKKQYDKTNRKYYMQPTVNLLNEYQDGLTFEDLTIDFYYGFLAFMYDHDENYKRGYINKTIQRIRQLCKAAIKEDITANRAFENFNLVDDETTQIYLSEKQISQLFYVSCKDKSEEILKDIFLISCGLGLRFSDWHNIKKENFVEVDGVMILTIKRTQKDKNALAIPINIFWWTKRLLEKYDYSPTIPPYQHFQLNLSKIAEAAGLVDVVEVVEYKKQRTVVQSRVCDEIGTHTARRSFITNCQLKNLKSADIKRMTGHKTDVSFKKYDKTKALDIALRIGKQNKLKAI